MEIKKYINLFDKLEGRRKEVFASMNRAFILIKRDTDKIFENASLGIAFLRFPPLKSAT